MLLNFIVITVGLATLLWSADRFVEGSATIARSMGMPPILIGMTIVSIGTSAPEILVSLMASITGSGDLAVGNAFGSNIANIGLVLGITLLISPFTVGRTTATKDLPLLLLTIITCGFLLRDGVLSLLDSLVLTVGLVIFFARLSAHLKHPDINDQQPDIPQLPLAKAWWLFLIGTTLLIASSRALVWSASNIAAAFGVSELVIGLTIVAIGTSLPELAASVVSARRGHADIAIGAVVGSNMFNLVVVLAIPGFFGNLTISTAALGRDLGTVLISTLLLTLFVFLGWNRTSHRGHLGRSAGIAFLALYALYTGWLFAQPNLGS
ncbi:putative K+-dependent Na+/Ca+ exchanger [Luminiphilus syltensis NOR5-1B]|uniref:Putative K+-dependent Na+/Ca+ exchanger n=1 Tax=Luminiphilus syltensis NOR5-1B TaxID=565045 RepID=B8KR80_9GAMM|nr:calcium/sodium antiporter [Luminiphilus syltensis]EED35578.1 putative K+-dependent Na+/Ca+ exchanger [Luminiphilus syltensis NOR5-1B]